MKRIYVGNLSYQSTEEALEALFGRFGSVGSTSIIRDRDTGQSRGFGFVEMEDDREAEAAIEALHGQPFEGRTLTVNEAQPRVERRSSGSRSGGGDQSRGRGPSW